MFISYKGQGNFRRISAKKLLCEKTIISSAIEYEEDYLIENICIDSGSVFFTKWEGMMIDGISPLKEIKYQYQNEIPIFDIHFLKSLTEFLKDFPKKGVKILNYIFKGPLQNILMLNWYYIYDILLKFLPNTINTISNSFFIDESSDLHHKSIFLEMGGLPLLYIYAKEEDFQLDLALILKNLSSFKLSNYYSKHIFTQDDQDDIFLGNDSIDSITKFIDDSSSFGIQTKIDSDIETDEIDEFAFCQFFESLLLSDDFDVRINTFDAILSLAKIDVSSRDFISRSILSHIDIIQSYEELTFALKILANSLTINSYIVPFISHLKDINKTFIETDDYEFDDAFCAFIENIFHGNDAEYIFLLGAVRKIAEIITTDLPFEVKRNVLVILMKIADDCDPYTFKKMMSEDLLSCLIDFLNIDDSFIVFGILSIFTKLIDNWNDLEVPLDYFNIISSERRTFANLQNSENTEFANSSSYILSFIDSFTDNDQNTS